MIFDEEASWNWHNNEEALETQILPNFEEANEADNEIVVASSDFLEFSTPINSPQRLFNSSSSLESSLEESPPRKFKSLREIYAKSQALFVAEPTCFNEAAEKEEWVKAMKEELIAINKNETWELWTYLKGKIQSG